MKTLKFGLFTLLMLTLTLSCGRSFEDADPSNPNTPDLTEGATYNDSLYYSVKNGEKLNAAQALELGADPNYQIDDTDTILTYAIRENMLEIVELLLEKRADPNLQTEVGDSPLVISIKQRKDKMIRALLKHGAMSNRVDKTKRLPLILAIGTEHLPTIFELLIGGANPHFDAPGRITPFNFVTRSDTKYSKVVLSIFKSHIKLKANGDVIKIIKDDLKNGNYRSLEYVNRFLNNERTSIIEKYGPTLFIDTFNISPKRYVRNLMKKYLEWGFDINDPQIRPPLVVAFTKRKEINNAILAIELGAKVNEPDEDNLPALWYATQDLNLELIAELRDAGASERLTIYGNNREPIGYVNSCRAIPRKQCNRRKCPPERLAAIAFLKKEYKCGK